jgi:2,3-bisphosphoglycerate-dependent phosphoglycerate mutase
MQFFYIRHAQSTNNALYTTTGSGLNRSEDPELTEIGQEQAEALADFLKRGNPDGGNGCHGSKQAGFGITHLYSSLMVRAIATGYAISNAIGVPLTAWTDIHEQGGIFLEDELTGEPTGLDGKDLAYFQAKYPHLILPEDFIESGWWNRRPLEKPEESLQRARRFLADLLDRHGHGGDRVAVVSHGGFYVDFLVALIDLPRPDGIWFRMNNAAITRIDFLDGKVDLIYQNRMDFLPAELVT